MPQRVTAKDESCVGRMLPHNGEIHKVIYIWINPFTGVKYYLISKPDSLPEFDRDAAADIIPRVHRVGPQYLESGLAIEAETARKLLAGGGGPAPTRAPATALLRDQVLPRAPPAGVCNAGARRTNEAGQAAVAAAAAPATGNSAYPDTDIEDVPDDQPTGREDSDDESITGAAEGKDDDGDDDAAPGTAAKVETFMLDPKWREDARPTISERDGESFADFKRDVAGGPTSQLSKDAPEVHFFQEQWDWRMQEQDADDHGATAASATAVEGI